MAARYLRDANLQSGRLLSGELQSGQPNDILGKALVMHAMPDDYTTQPSGNSGDRIACGGVAGQPN